MSEFEDKLNAILSNPEAMGQIMNLAQTLGKDTDRGPEPSSPDDRGGGTSSSGPGDFSDAQAENPLSALGSLDPRLLNMAANLMSAYQSNDDDRAALLTALRPFVKPERYAKLDQAIRISKLTRIIRVALDSFRSKGESDHV